MPDRLPTYNLKAVIHETGLNAETIRAWERRYGLPKPQRTPGRHRMYSLRDIRTLKWLMKRQEEGMSISRAVEHWRSLEKSGQDPLRLKPESPDLVAPGKENSLDSLRLSWIAACLRFDEPEAEQALAQAFAIAPPETACVEVIQRGISELGGLWYQNKASVQNEHFATDLATRRLHALIAAAPPPSRTMRLLTVAPPHEEHSFGLLLLTYLLRRYGWDVIFLGANITLQGLRESLQLIKPAAVISTAETLTSAASLKEMAVLLQEQDVPLMYGGSVFSAFPPLMNQISGHYLGDRLMTAPQEVERLLNENLPTAQVQPLSPAYTEALKDFREARLEIDASAVRYLHQMNLSPELLESNGLSFSDHIEAALRLGDMGSINLWYGWTKDRLPSTASVRLLISALRVYSQVIQEEMGVQGELIVNCLDSILATQTR